MIDKQTSDSETILDEIVTQPYKYGFKTAIETEEFPKGINLNIVEQISLKKNEPQFLKDFRIKAFKNWQKMQNPKWAYIKLPAVNYQEIQYYSIPKTKTKLGSLDDADPELLKTFEKLGVSLNEQKLLANVAVDAVFDSVSIGTTFKKQLQKSASYFVP
jgi:Fe-S cluster assembly protein SufB